MLIVRLDDKDIKHIMNKKELGINPLYRLKNLN